LEGLGGGENPIVGCLDKMAHAKAVKKNGAEVGKY